MNDPLASTRPKAVSEVLVKASHTTILSSHARLHHDGDFWSAIAPRHRRLRQLQGNMDFNEISRHNIYLPSRTPALCSTSATHTPTGDGNSTATLSRPRWTRVHRRCDPGHAPALPHDTRIVSGLNGSLDDAMRSATGDMVRCRPRLQAHTIRIAQLLGTASEYKISEVADRNAASYESARTG
jgi:hypothetical protein